MTRDEFHEEVKCNSDYLGWHNAHELADKLYSSVKGRKCDEYTKKEGIDIVSKISDGLEIAMKEMGLNSLSSDNVIRIAEYAVISGVITTKRLVDIEEAHIKSRSNER